MDLSIIIPVYNTPAVLLQRCLDSAQNLHGLDLEVILCDDGSGDATASFCQEYAKQNPHIQYIRKENGGVSSARNLGLDHATGRYVTFVDADDALLPDSITPDLFSEGHDLVILDVLLDSSGHRTQISSMDTPAGAITTGCAFKQMIVSTNMNSPCAKLYRRELLESNRLRFNTDFITGEDWLFVCDFLSHCNTVCYTGTCCYIYYRDGSTSLGRLSRFPDVMLSNLEAVYQKRLSLCQQAWAVTEQAQLESTAAAAWLENLFNLAADLLLMKKLTPERKRHILSAAKEAATHLTENAPKKARQKAMILQHFWVAVGPLALLRRLYLKLR